MSPEQILFDENSRLSRLRQAIIEQYDVLYRSGSHSTEGYWERTGFKPLGLRKKRDLFGLVKPSRCDTCNSRTDQYEIQVIHPNRPTAKPDLPLIPVTPQLWQWIEGKLCKRCPDARLVVMERIQDDFAAGNRFVQEIKLLVDSQ